MITTGVSGSSLEMVDFILFHMPLAKTPTQGQGVLGNVPLNAKKQEGRLMNDRPVLPGPPLTLDTPPTLLLNPPSSLLSPSSFRDLQYPAARTQCTGLSFSLSALPLLRVFLVLVLINISNAVA